MKKLFCLLLFGICLPAIAAQQVVFKHVPPQTEQIEASPLKLSLDNPELLKARVLVARQNGYQAIEMTRTDSGFVAELDFGTLAIFKYQFQVQTQDERYLESPVYKVRQSSSKSLEENIEKLKGQLEQVSANKTQLERSLFALKQADEDSLRIKAKQDLAKALLELGDKERELASLLKGEK